jgi:hypothetical protein
MHRKHKRKKKRQQAFPNTELSISRTVDQEPAPKQESAKIPTGKGEESMDSFVQLLRTDTRFRIELGALVVGVLFLVIYGCQLDQMIKSNRISRESVESVQRALVYFSGQPAYIKRVVGNKVGTLTIVIPWENSGVTPAMNGKSMVNWRIFHGPNGIPDNFTYPDEGQVKPRQFDIPPKSSGNGTMDVPIWAISSAKNGVGRLYVHGWIVYDDIFKGRPRKRNTPRHLSEFCSEITNIKSIPDDITDPNVNITWELSLCPEHNCSDERCADYKEKTQ